MASTDNVLDAVEEIFQELGNTDWSSFLAAVENFTQVDGDGIVEPRRNRFVDAVRRCNLRRRLCHDILPVDSYENANEYDDRIRKQRYSGQLLICSYHESSPEWQHVHVVHDCGWTAGTCRCATFAGLPFQRRRRAVWTGGLDSEYISNLGIYLFLPPRTCLYYFLAGTRREIPGPDEINTDDGSQDNSQGTVMDENDEICAIRGDTVDGEQVPESSEPPKRRKRQHSNQRQDATKTTVKEIVRFFETYPVCPLLSSCKTAQWLENVNLCSIGRSDPRFVQAIDIFQRQICNKSIPELIEFYLNSNPLFDCSTGHIYEYYYSIEESRNKLLEFLQYQCNYDELFIKEFLEIVYKILDCKYEKQNCIQIKGPSNAGKTLFSKICSSLCLVKGQIANFNKYCQFPLEDCVDKRILIWDEPNCEPSSFDKCKILFSGDPCMANIKYQSHVQIDKTPIIITTNVDVFPNNVIFNNRMFKFYWQTAPMLKEFKKNIHPLALYELWKLYAIINVNTFLTDTQ